MSLAQPDGPSSIATHVQNCLEGFHDACSKLAKAGPLIRSKIPPGVMHDCLGRFRLWVGNIGAHRKGKASLDYKLREASHIRIRVLELLQNLESVLQEAQEIITGQRVPWEDLSDSDSEASDDELEQPRDEPSTELAQLVSNIAEVNSCLMRLSLAIRNPAPHDQFKESIQIDVAHFEAFDVDHVRDKFPQAADYLVLRLGKAISRRRQYLRYREDHRRKLEKGLKAPDLEGLSAPSQIAPTVAGPSEKIESTVASSLPLAIKTSTSATNLDDDDYYEDTLSQTSYASSHSDPAKLRPPTLPEAGQDGEPFECPLCFRFTSVRQATSWHKHVYRDLQPYVCTFDDCNIPDRTYESRHEWFQHELQAHRKWWECIEGCNRVFRSLHAFHKHLANEHEVFADNDRTIDLVHNCERQESMNTEANCELCGMNLPTLTQLRRHLGKHHEELSLFALPSHMKEDDNEHDEGQVENDSASSVVGSDGCLSADQVVCGHCGLSFEDDRGDEQSAFIHHVANCQGDQDIRISSIEETDPRFVEAKELLRKEPSVVQTLDDQMFDETLIHHTLRLALPENVNTWMQLKDWVGKHTSDLNHGQITVLQAIQFRTMIIAQESALAKEYQIDHDASPDEVVLATEPSSVFENTTKAHQILVQNLSNRCLLPDLHSLLLTVGQPVDYQILRDVHTGTFHGHATATFASQEETQRAAYYLNRVEHMGMTLTVRITRAPFSPPLPPPLRGQTRAQFDGIPNLSPEVWATVKIFGSWMQFWDPTEDGVTNTWWHIMWNDLHKASLHDNHVHMKGLLFCSNSQPELKDFTMMLGDKEEASSICAKLIYEMKRCAIKPTDPETVLEEPSSQSSAGVLSSNFAAALRTQDKVEYPLFGALPCPYPSHHDRMFQNVDSLYDHTKVEHATEIAGFSSSEARKMLRDAALDLGRPNQANRGDDIMKVIEEEKDASLNEHHDHGVALYDASPSAAPVRLHATDKDDDKDSEDDSDDWELLLSPTRKMDLERYMKDVSLQDSLRLACTWRGFVFTAWVRLDRPGEETFDDIQREMVKRSVPIDRANKSLLLRRPGRINISGKSKNHHQPLDKELLESGWKDTVQWLRENKIPEPEPPHIWGTIIDRPPRDISPPIQMPNAFLIRGAAEEVPTERVAESPGLHGKDKAGDEGDEGDSDIGELFQPPQPGRFYQRNLQEAKEAKASRKADIERRCQEMSPPIPLDVLQHMESFKAAVQISQPLNDYAWSVLQPRLLAQLPAAQQATEGALKDAKGSIESGSQVIDVKEINDDIKARKETTTVHATGSSELEEAAQRMKLPIPETFQGPTGSGKASLPANIFLKVVHKYSCGHEVVATAPNATSKTSLDGVSRVKTVNHNDEKCETCEAELADDEKHPRQQPHGTVMGIDNSPVDEMSMNMEGSPKPHNTAHTRRSVDSHVQTSITNPESKKVEVILQEQRGQESTVATAGRRQSPEPPSSHNPLLQTNPDISGSSDLNFLDSFPDQSDSNDSSDDETSADEVTVAIAQKEPPTEHSPSRNSSSLLHPKIGTLSGITVSDEVGANVQGESAGGSMSGDDGQETIFRDQSQLVNAFHNWVTKCRPEYYSNFLLTFKQAPASIDDIASWFSSTQQPTNGFPAPNASPNNPARVAPMNGETHIGSDEVAHIAEAPTDIPRPAPGATKKELSNALLGPGNALNDQSRRKIKDKSK